MIFRRFLSRPTTSPRRLSKPQRAVLLPVLAVGVFASSNLQAARRPAPGPAVDEITLNAGSPQNWLGDGGSGGNGTWSTATDWNPNTWVAGNIAVFGGTAGTVTVGTQTAGGLTFNVGGYSLASGTLTLATSSVLTTATGTSTLGSNLALAGAAGVILTKTGPGTLSLLASSGNGGLGTVASPSVWTVTGGTKGSSGVFDSILAINFGSSLGATPTTAATQLVLDAGTLQITGTALAPAIGANRTFQINAAGGTIVDSTGNPFQNAVANGAGSASSLYLSNASGTTTFSGIISGAGGLTWNGAGTLALTGVNAYTGSTTINGGVLSYTTNSSLGAAGTVLNLNGGTLASAQTAGVTMTRTLATGTVGGTIRLNNLVPSNGNSKLTLGTANQLTGSGPLTVTNNGLLSVGGANTGFSGAWTLNGGVLELTTGTAAGTGGITVNTGAELTTLGSQITNPLTLNGGQIGWDFYSNSGDYQGPVTLGTSGGIVSLVNFYGAGAINGSISAPVSGVGALSTSNTGPSGATSGGVLTLSGNNTYSGGTSVGAGTTLKIGGNTALGTGPLSIAGTLNLNGFSPTVGSLSLAGGSTFNFTLSASSVEQLTASSVATSGTAYLAFNPAALTATGTYPLLKSTGGTLTGAFNFSGAENLTVPANSIITKNANGAFFRLTLSNSVGTEQLVVSSDVPAKRLTILPFGSSITAGQSAQSPYNGGGYRQQLYQDLVNDGRFTPDYVGSSVATLANNPSGGLLLSSANQLSHEGHPGWNTQQMLANLGDLYNGDSGANGGMWLKVGNGENPDLITVNIGGNDAVNYGVTADVMTEASHRLDAIVSKFNSLRPGVGTILSTIVYRADNLSYSNQGIDPYYNPTIGVVVFNHVLAGQNVGYLDLRSLIEYPADISSDKIHPIQTGYDKMADAWYQSIAYGAAYWTGSQNRVWNTLNGTATNWAMDRALTTDRQKILNDPAANTSLVFPDVYFGNNLGALPTTLGADTTVRSLNFTSGAAGSVTVGAGNVLTIGSVDTNSGSGTAYFLANTGGITVQAGSGAHTVAADLALGADQTWGNVSSNNLTVGGGISGARNLSFVGAYTVYNPGVYTPNGTDYAHATFTTTSATGGGTGGFLLSGNATYTGTTTLGANAKVTVTGALSGTSAVSVAADANLTVDGSVNPAAGIALNGTLRGTGTVGGVTATGNAKIAPGDFAGTLTVGALALPSTASLEIECGATTGDRLVVTGDAQVGGAVNVALLSGSRVTAFNREILTVNGTLDATGLRIGTVPAGLSAADFSLQITGGHVVLRYADTATGGSYGFFRSSYFTAAQQADPLVSGPAADPDRDGLSNAVEYALGLNPTTAMSSPLATTIQPAGGVSGSPRVLALNLSAPQNPPADATLSVRQGTDLSAVSSWPVIATRDGSGTWTASGGASVIQGVPANGYTPVTVYGTFSPDNGTFRAFLRLEATVP